MRTKLFFFVLFKIINCKPMVNSSVFNYNKYKINYSKVAKYLSASRAAIQPVPAAVIACRYT